MQINIPYSSLLRGSSLRENYGFERRSEPQYFQDLFLVSPNFKRRDNVYGVAGPGGVVYLPVYEIESYAFDRWTVENSHYIFHKRDINYTHAMALDGTQVEGDEEHRNRLRRAIGQVLDNESYFMRADQYVNIAENGETLRGGEMSLYLPDEPAEFKPLSRELAELVMRVWQVCWMRMRWMMEKRVAWNATAPRSAPHVEILAVNAADLPDQTKTLSECVRFFREELAPALPPQVMSMLSVAIGCSPNNRDENWPDAACRIYLDGGRFTSRDAVNMFDFRGWQEDKRKTPQVHAGASNPNAAWEDRLIGCLCEGRYPRFYEAISQRFNAVDVLADFELLRWCTMSELYIDFFDQAGVAERYKAIQYAAKSLDNVCVLLEAHHISRAEACLALMDAFDELTGKVERMPELRLAEYDILATAYKALRENAGNERANAVAERLMGQLGRQIRVPDYEGSAIDFWNEKNGRAALELDPLSLRLVEGELQMLERAGGLSPAEFERWCKRYDTLSRGGEDALCLRLERELSRQLRFDDPGAASPLSVAEANGLDSVAIRIVRGIIQDLFARKQGRLTEQEYRQVLEFYADTKRDYGARLEDAAQPARELLCGQFGFEDSEVEAADLLSQRELPDLWNRLTESEARQLAAGPQPLESDRFEVWARRLENESISAECADSIIEMIVDRAPKENQAQYVEAASARQLGALERALVRSMLEDVDARQSVSAEEYRWWIGRQQDAQDEGKPFADEIYAMLTRINLRDDADGKRIAQQAQHWRLLGDLALASAPKVVNLTVEKYRDWIGYYKDLEQNDFGVAPEAVGAIRELLNKKISDETLAMLQEQNVRGDLYWSAMQNLLERQRDGSAGMRADVFSLWMKRMAEATRESKPIAGEIRALLTEQYRLRTDDEPVFAFDEAGKAGADADMLVSLINVEFDRSLANAAPADVEAARRWLRHYKFLKRQGRDELAAAVKDRLCRRPMVDGRFMLDLANEEEVVDLQLELIRAEKENSLDGRSIGDIESCDRWLSHYVSLKRQGQESAADEVARKLCESPVIEGRYVLGMALAHGAEDLESRLIEKEKTAVRPYSDEEYGERLHRLLGGTGYKTDYVELLTDSSKSENGEAFDRFVRSLKARLGEVSSDNAAAVTEVFRTLAASARSIRPETLADLREMAGIPAIQAVLKADQAGLGRVVRESLNEGCGLADLRTLYPLLEKRMPEMDARAAREFAESAFADTGIDSFARYCPSMDGEMAPLVEHEIRNLIEAGDIDGEALPKVAEALDAVGMPRTQGLPLIAEALKKAKGTVRVDALSRYARDAGESARQALMSALAEWTATAVGQSPEMLNALADYVSDTGLTSQSLLSDKLFEGVKGYIEHGNDCSGVTEATYERLAALWRGREDYDAVAMPLLDGIEALSGKMRGELSARMRKGPVQVDAKFSRVTAVRDAMELSGFLQLIQDAATLDDMVEHGREQPWINGESLARAASADDGQQRLAELVDLDFGKRIEDLRISGEKLPILNGLTRLVALLGDERFELYGGILEPHVDRLIQEKSQEAFQECCQAYDGQSRAACEGFAQLKALLERVKADDSKPLSVSTAVWCGEFASAVLSRGTLDRRRAEELLRSLHQNRQDMGNLRVFCGRVYQISLAQSEIRSEIDVLLLLCPAKAKNYDEVWTRYLALAMKLEDDSSIWKDGRDTDISTIVVFTYNALDGYAGDEAVSQMSLADYCVGDERFIDLQKRQKNAALKEIFQKSSSYHGKHKGGLFGFLRR